jgi:hypothetical protein
MPLDTENRILWVPKVPSKRLTWTLRITTGNHHRRFQAIEVLGIPSTSNSP